MKKKVKKFFALVCLGGVSYLLAKLVQNDDVKDKLFEVMGEDRYLAVEATARLAIDVLQWPIHFVRALLP